MAASETRKLKLWQGRVETEIEISGAGPPLVWLHGPWGLAPDRGFLEGLAASHTVYAPKHPGTSLGNSDAVHAIDDWLDLVVYYAELFDRLGLARPDLIGHSFGGMVAAEIAAAFPAAVARLVLIDPVGLWRDDLPVKNWMILPEETRRRALFADPAGAQGRRFFGLPDDPAARVAAQVASTWALACTGKFAWPIPDRGLKKRIHRITAPTLILWGEADGIIAPAYAQEFAGRIAASRVETIAAAGHLPHLERPEEVARAIGGFLAT
jgi:pimeloyl-ACP methyl ester carboxylesterase